MNPQLAATWTHLLLIGLVLTFVVYSRRRMWRRAALVPTGAIAVACLLRAVFTWPGLLSAQKVATELAMPMGLMWLGLLCVVLWAWSNRRPIILACLLPCWLLLTLAGNGLLGGVLLAWLEHDYAAINPLEQGSFDAVLVLGGGLSSRESGYVQLNSAGDRVALGARLYQTGRTTVLVCAGQEIPGSPEWKLDGGTATRMVWRQLKIPDSAVLQVSARNTSEEIAAFADLAAGRDWRKVGIVTSAWHMKRALRLAGRYDLALEPLPADFRGTLPDPWKVIPNPHAFANTEMAVKEMLAMAVGR